jgi:hypothetical protein
MRQQFGGHYERKAQDEGKVDDVPVTHTGTSGPGLRGLNAESGVRDQNAGTES